MTPKLYLSWAEFDAAVDRLVPMLRTAGASGIYGVPRGGLILAVALSHRLDLPLYAVPDAGCIWVDDIIDSGRTREEAPLATAYAAWVSRRPRWDTYVAQLCRTDAWLVFPWEPAEKADADHAAYQLSRS